MTEGIIIKGIGGFYYVSDGETTIECRARGKFRKQKIKPQVGDMVEVTRLGDQGAVEVIKPRKNSLIRPPVANIDQIVIVIAAAKPKPDFFVMDKLIIQAELNKIDIVVCVNKTDLQSPDEIIKIYKSAGYKTLSVCAMENRGTEDLKPLLHGKITAFAGNSGVGKSSILNTLGFSLETGEVSKIEHGKHTTRHVELMPFEKDGYVIDTPGFSLLDLHEIRAEQLEACFREFGGHGECEFKDCTHDGVRGCKIAEAVKEGKIAESRYESYRKLYEELSKIKEWERD